MSGNQEDETSKPDQPQQPSFEWEGGSKSIDEADAVMKKARQHNDRARAFYDQDKFEEAEKEVRQALELAPNWPALHDNLGTICAEQGNFSDAFYHYAQALKLDPTSPTVMYNVGYFLLQNGLDAAQFFLEKTLQLDSNYPDARRVLGDVFVEQGETSKAISSLGKAIQQNRQDTRARFRLSDIFWEQGDYHESAQQLEEVLRIDPQDHIAWHNLGLTSIMLEDDERAERALRKAIEIDPNYLMAHYHLACFYAEGFRFEEAFYHLNQAAALDPDSVRNWALEDEKLDRLRSDPRFDRFLSLG